jgi:hypothetical protein
VLRWARRPPNRVRVVTASTVAALGIVVVLLLTADHGVYWFRAEPRPDAATSLPGGDEQPGPDVALTVGPERTATNPPPTPTHPPSTPAGPPGATPAATPAPPGTRAPLTPPPTPLPAPPQRARCAVTFARSGSWSRATSRP